MSSASLAVPYHTNREVTYFLYVCRQRVEGVSFTYLVKGEMWSFQALDITQMRQ